jgi:hypothetical protein
MSLGTTWPAATHPSTHEPNQELQVVGVTSPGADLDPFFNTSPDVDDGDDL